MIDDLLDQSLISLGRLRLRTELVNAHELLQQSLENCAEFLRDANLIAHLDLAATNSRIAADPSRLQQVFWNLIINAARNSPARSQLTIRTRNIAADALAIEFQDEGRGLEASRLEKIFEPFIQGTADGVERGPGLGLGLSIGRWIIEAHRGNPGRGESGSRERGHFPSRPPHRGPHRSRDDRSTDCERCDRRGARCRGA